MYVKHSSKKEPQNPVTTMFNFLDSLLLIFWDTYLICQQEKNKITYNDAFFNVNNVVFKNP